MILKLILHYNTPDQTAALSGSIPGAVVVDNGSDPPYRGPGTVIRYQDNLGFTRNWNRVIAHLLECYRDRDTFFWLMNSDIVISPEAVQRMEEVVSLAGVDVVTPSYNCWIHQCRPQGSGGLRRIKCLELTAPVIRGEVFRRVGLFDPSFSLGSGVDFDFCLRLQKAGVAIHCDDASSFHHLRHVTIGRVASLNDYSARANAEMERGMTRLYGHNWKQHIRNKLDINKKPDTMKVAVYTTIFAGYDALQRAEKQSVPADFFCLTDDTAIKPPAQGVPWTILPVLEPRKDLHPRLRAKWFKIFPWENETLAMYDVVIYLDGCFSVVSADFVSFCLSSLKGDIALFKHPKRDCIFEEQKASAAMVKYQGEPLERQADYYAKFFPAGGGLYACGVIVRRNSPQVRSLMMSWWHEQIKFSFQDQVSFPVVCRLHKIVPDILAGDIFNNPFLKALPHLNSGDQGLSEAAVKDPSPAQPPMTRDQVINMIIRTMGYNRYLEIGLRDGDTFFKVQAQVKESVDQVIRRGVVPTYKMTSDEYFRGRDPGAARPQLVFIDGDHDYEQVKKDLQNAVNILSDFGCIVLHDTNPPKKEFTDPLLSGSCFKIIADLFFQNFDLEYYTLPMPQDEANGITILFLTNRGAILKSANVTFKDLREYDTFDKLRAIVTNAVTFADLVTLTESVKAMAGQAGWKVTRKVKCRQVAGTPKKKAGA